VWGNSNKFTLNQGNIDTLVEQRGLSVLLNDLLRTIHDAITATEKIGEQYLWVDSMCIQQDNELEKEEQIDVMDWVYGNAVLTFVAADASDADAGLRGVQSGSRNVKQLEAEIQTSEHILIPLPKPKGLESSIWNSRAWTL
jgi:hypothetical protein